MTYAQQGKKRGHVLDQQAKRYIINAIDSDGYETEPLNTIDSKIKFLQQTFTSEYGWHLERTHNVQTSVKEWLMGLPSCLDIVFYNHDIIQLAIEWESLPVNHTEAQAQKIIDNYWNFMAAKIAQLFRGYHVPADEVNYD